MNGYVIAAAVIDRLQADSSLYTAGAWTSIIAGGISTLRGNAQDPTLPLAVVDVSWNANHGLGYMYGAYEVTITYFYGETLSNGGRDFVDRCIGNAMLAGGTNYTPTYGLHNHALSLPSLGADNILGMTSGQLTYQSFDMGEGDTPDTKRVVLTFTGNTQKNAVNT